MKITRLSIIKKGLRCRCPNCGRATVFKTGSLFRVNESCPGCGLKIEAGDGAFLGPFALNYGLTAFGVIVPVLVLRTTGRLGSAAAVTLCVLGALLVPVLLYRLSWALWLTLYYFFLPWNLPGNREGQSEDDE